MLVVLLMVGCARPCGSSYSGSCKPIGADGLCYDRRYSDELLTAGHTGVLEWIFAGVNNDGPADTGVDATCLHVRVVDCGSTTAFARQVDLDGAVVMAFDSQGRVIGQLFEPDTFGECQYVAVGEEEAAACMREAQTLLDDSAYRCNSTICDEDFCAQLD